MPDLSDVAPSSGPPAVPVRRAARKAVGSYAERDADVDEEMESEEESGDAPTGDHWDSACSACGKGGAEAGELLCCSFKAGKSTCSRVYHPSCLEAPPARAQKGKWLCPVCEKKQELNMVEKFLAIRYVAAGQTAEATKSKPRPRELFCKWQDMSYMHCDWQPEAWVVDMSAVYPGLKQRYRNFMAKVDQRGGIAGMEREDEENGLEHGVDPQWLSVERIIACEEEDGTMMYLTKWKGLEYEHSTWEEAADLAQFQDELAAFKALKAVDEMAATLRAQHEAALKAAGSKRDARTYTETPPFLPGGQLHPYQLDGLNWLLLRCHRNQNMILADEMGLGKTVQSISFLACLREMGNPKPHLVVVPLSTMPNWERELAKWAPQLYVISIKGSQASRDTIRKYESYITEPSGKVSKKDRNRNLRFNVALTTYETVQQEMAWLGNVEWATLTVDEGHRLKNAKSKLFQILKDFSVERRVLLTGTPLQNNLDELFFLMSFIEPGKFDSLSDFQEKFAQINKQEQVEKLHGMLAEHILRRVKKDVLKQLPPKREQIVRVELSRQQKDFYKQILIKQYPALAGKEGHSSSGHLKNVMMELRKCCNHPYLFEGVEEAAAQADPQAALEALIAASGKLQLLDRMMHKFKEDKHRVLIYSQFTRTLDLMETWLTGRQWQYQRIDGSIRGPDRQLRIDKFNNQPDVYWVFLLSTRAGGLGINLATADTVVIFDSDWNPHNDIQAQARAHRLGQQKPVFTYRLVTRATVEERMMQRAKEKRMLETVVMGRPDLKQSDLDDILRYGAMDLFMDDDDEAAAGTGGGDAAAERGTGAVAADSAAADSAAADSAAAASRGADGAAPMEVQDGEAGKAQAAGNGATATAQGTSDAAKGAGGKEKPGGKEKRKDKRIVYDEGALARMLDRDAALSLQQEEEEDNEFMAAFKVANFELSDAEAAALLEKEKADSATEATAVEGKFWDALLKEHYVDTESQEQAMLGRGRRRKAKVSYVDQEQDDEGKPPNKRKRDDGDSDSDEWQPDEREEDATSMYNNESPSSPQFAVYGLTQRARNDFVRCVLTWGLPMGSSSKFEWESFTRRLIKLPTFSACAPEDLESYGKLLLHILSNETPSVAVDSPMILLPGTGKQCPRSIFYDRSRAVDILERMGVLHLIRTKLAETQAQPEGTFSINCGANHDRKWFLQQASVLAAQQEGLQRGTPAPGAWTPAHDRRLLQGVVKHGAVSFSGRLISDDALGLAGALRAALGIPEYVNPSTAQPVASVPAGGAAAVDVEADAEAQQNGADGGPGAPASSGRATASAGTPSAADVQRYMAMEAQFLRARFDVLVHELGCEFVRRPPNELPYGEGVVAWAPLLESALTVQHLGALLHAANNCEAANLAIQDHTRKAVGAAHPQAMTDAAARFRSLVNDYNLRVRTMHHAALSALTWMVGPGRVPAVCLPDQSLRPPPQQPQRREQPPSSSAAGAQWRHAQAQGSQLGAAAHLSSHAAPGSQPQPHGPVGPQNGQHAGGQPGSSAPVTSVPSKRPLEIID